MVKSVLKFIAVILLSGLLFLLFKLFMPGTYQVLPFQERAGELYWNLPTGSRIGYTLVPAKGIKKPYPIIFLQGGPGGSIGDQTIQMLAPLAENGFDIYLYDQLGAGHSGRLDDITAYTAERHKQDLAAIISQIGAEKVILIGQSWGASLATYYVADYPDQVAKLILTGPGPIYPVNSALKDIQPPDSLQIRAPQYTNRQGNEKMNTVRTTFIAWYAKAFGQKIASDREADDFNAVLSQECRKSCVCDTSAMLPNTPVKGGSGFYVSVMTMESLAQMPDPRPKLKGSTIPLLLMRGQCDNQKWGFQTEYFEYFPNHQLAVIPGAGHIIALEQPDLYLKTLRDFLLK